MTSRKLASAAAAACLAGAAVLGMGAPAMAQTGSELPQVAGASDSTPAPGQSVTITTGSASFTPGSTVRFTLVGSSVSGTAVANRFGSASFTFVVPLDTPPGSAVVRASGTLAGVARTVDFPITVVASSTAAPAQGGSAGGQTSGSQTSGSQTSGGQSAAAGRALPRTGSDQMVPLAITGVVLVGAGAGLVIASRRRREDLPAGIA